MMIPDSQPTANTGTFFSTTAGAGIYGDAEHAVRVYGFGPDLFSEDEKMNGLEQVVAVNSTGQSRF